MEQMMMMMMLGYAGADWVAYVDGEHLRIISGRSC